MIIMLNDIYSINKQNNGVYLNDNADESTITLLVNIILVLWALIIINILIVLYGI